MVPSHTIPKLFQICILRNALETQFFTETKYFYRHLEQYELNFLVIVSIDIIKSGVVDNVYLIRMHENYLKE